MVSCRIAVIVNFIVKSCLGRSICFGLLFVVGVVAGGKSVDDTVDCVSVVGSGV